jgi:dTDP-glucose 4,6-dehydratase
VVKTVLKALGQPESLISYVKDRPGHDRRYAMDYSLAQAELGFTPKYTFEQGIAETLAWYHENSQWLEQVQSGSYRAFMDTWYGERL